MLDIVCMEYFTNGGCTQWNDSQYFLLCGISAEMYSLTGRHNLTVSFDIYLCKADMDLMN